MTNAETKTGKLVVVGQGYVGLPLAMRAVEAGFDVVGFDTDTQRIKRLGSGDSYVEDITADVLERGECLWPLRTDHRAEALRRIRLCGHRRPHATRRRRSQSHLRDRRR